MSASADAAAGRVNRTEGVLRKYTREGTRRAYFRSTLSVLCERRSARVVRLISVSVSPCLRGHV
jgi:hypothetical protein